MRKLIIHAGVHRTGTTAIQNFLYRNKKNLEEFGCCYPGEKVNHQDIAWELYRKEITYGNLKEFINKYSSESCKSIILSAEDFCINEDLHWVSQACQDFDVYVYMVLRRQDQWIESWYNQHVKWPFDRAKSMMDPMEFLECIDDFYWIKYNKNIENWKSVVGMDKIKISVMGSDQVGGFLKFSVPGWKIFEKEKKDNSSMSPESIEIIRRLGIFDLKPRERMKIINAVKSVVPNTSKYKHIYSRSLRKMIVSYYNDGNIEVGKKYFGLDGSPFSNDFDDYLAYYPYKMESLNIINKLLPDVVRNIALQN